MDFFSSSVISSDFALLISSSPFSVDSFDFCLFPISDTDNGETVFIVVGVENISSEGSLKGIGLHSSE